MRLRKILRSTGLTLLAIFVLLTVIGYFLPNPPKSNSQSSISTPTTNATTPAVAAIPPVASSTQSSPELNAAQKLDPKSAYADFVLNENANVMSAGMSMGLSASQVQQAVEFKNLDEYRKIAESLEDVLKKRQSDEISISYPDGLADNDQKVFDDLRNASEDVLAQYLSTAADIGVNAHTGLDVSADLDKDTQLSVAALKKFRQVAKAGYRHFGFKPSQIDDETLQPKDDHSAEVSKS